MDSQRKSARKVARLHRLLALFPGSGLRVKDFCKRHRISKAQYYYWRGRIKATVPPLAPKNQPSFVRVSRLDLPVGTGHYELFLSAGLRLRIPPDFNRESLSSLLSVLSC